ncbi:aspartyl protease family protein 2 [Sorghum bicolor]|uniref:Peptidase A1 domain-containing protein n=1 Tax=Sorghum bicolor TaxID=4558 RepID=A0A1B6PEH1_SORBI|nr:aspartyl protease family protein 2 [Sorghum bicolor]KXG24092.1 hypothetical protein SORBI_3008G184400 [Sorghum bicolor]|eukprot:XP_002442593.2 aspartyl protease family protein 2 [Sorghum bicolor]
MQAMAWSSLAGLLLLLLLAACSDDTIAVVGVANKPVEYEYHNFLASPLSPHTYTAPAAAAAMPSSSSALQVRLVHRDSFAVNASAADLLARRLQRDMRRAAWIITKAATPADPENGTVVTGAPTSGEYIAKITVGTPYENDSSFEALLSPDMGSDVTWLQCMPCFRCYHQPGPVYNRLKSSSASDVGCYAPACRALGSSGGCVQFLNECQYKVEYGDGSSSAGDFGVETLTFPPGVRVPGVAIGCGSDNQGLFPAPAAGILGLGRGSLSFPSQIAGRYGRSFSYCLAGQGTGGRSSTLTFGSGASATTTTTTPPSFTPMLTNSRMYTFYYVGLVGISVGGVRVRGVTESDLRLDPSTGHGGVIVDSGTAVTRLSGPAYAAFRDAFRVAAVKELGWPSPGGPFAFFDTCYSSVRGRVMKKVPAVSMHFAGGVEVKLPPQNYLIPVDSNKGTMCFAFAGSGDRGVSIIGNIQLQGFRVVYDVDGQRVGFAPNSC